MLDRSVQAQELLDGGGQQVGPVAQEPVLAGVGEQRQHGVADQVDGGFVSGPEQQEHRGHEFFLAEGVIAVSGLDEGSQQVAAGALA